MTSHLAAVFVLTLAFLAAGIDTYAATLVVTKTADTADGICDADCSLREAVAAAASGDTVIFSPLFSEPQTITLTGGQIPITAKLTMDGPGAGLLTVSGNNAGRIFHISGGVDVTLVGMTLRDGRVTSQDPPGGGAILLLQSFLTLNSMVLSNNTAPVDVFGLGGGVYVDRGTLIVRGSTINNNAGGGIQSISSTVDIATSTISNNQQQGVNGGGSVNFPGSVTVMDSMIHDNTGRGIINSNGPTIVIRCTVMRNWYGINANSGNSTFTLSRSIISGNEPGGGVSNSGIGTITDTMIDDNFANVIGGDGGGIDNTGTLYIINSSITNNRAFESGGGIDTARGHLYLTNSTVSGNRADNGGGNCNCPGGGIYSLWNTANPGGTVIITNSTITNNRSAGKGGGIRNDAGAIFVVRNTIIAGNLATSGEVDVSGVAESDGFNLIGNTSGSAGWVITDLLNLKPNLAPLGINGGLTRTHALLPGSPAINTGNNELSRDPLDNSPLIFDQRALGYGRIISKTVDIGAYEANYASTPVTLAGLILADTGRGISKATVILTDPTGTSRFAMTNPFGYYRFVDVPPGITYTIVISHKSFHFDSPQFITVDRDRDDLDFTAQ